jgi:plasmid maintenance system antidote protein VapI
LKGQAAITPGIAIRHSNAFDTTSEGWLTQQMQYDLWKDVQ